MLWASPRVFVHNETGDIQLADPHNLPKEFHFATLSEITTLPITQKFPFDFYNPKVNSSLKELKCKFCSRTVGTKAQMLRHRRGMHKYQRASMDDSYPIELDLETVQMENAIRVVAKRGLEYLVEFPDDIEWVACSSNHRLVLDFL